MTDSDPPPGLANKRAAARAALWFEQLWPAAWPPLATLGVFATLALLDIPAYLPPWPRLLLFPLTLLTAAALLWRSLHRLTRPTPDTIDRRLERASGLRHRPLATLHDQPASPTPEALALWQIHRDRIRAQLGSLRIGALRPGLPATDLRALRGLVLLAFAAALVAAGAEAPKRLLFAVAPGLPPGPAAPATLVQAWLTPPAYTGLAPVFLIPGQPAPRIPTGAHLTVSVTGGSASPTLSYGSDATTFDPLDATSWQAERDVTASARLAIHRGPSELAGWTLDIIPDHPPTAAFADPPGPATSGGRTTLQTRLAWRAEDDYGVASIQSEIRLAQRPDAPPIITTSPVGGSPKQARGAFVQDLTAHPWAGLPVIARVIAKDAAKQAGTSPDASFDLPERTFNNLGARAVIAVRKQLSLTPDDRQPARQALDAIADRPDLFESSTSVFLNLRAIGSLLARGRGQRAIDEAQSRLWELALALEEGVVDRTARALEQARQAARDALEEAKRSPEDQAKQAELERRTQELREAIQRQLEALTEQARRDGTDLPFDPTAPNMNARDLDRMAQEMEKSAKEGRMEDAKRQMAELERLLEQLQNARPEHGEQRERRNAERRQQGRQQQDAVQDIIRREGDLLDRSRSRADAGPSPRQNETAPNPSTPPQAAREQDGRAQRAMRRALGELMQRFGDVTGQVPAPLGEADTAMREAGQALADGRESAAGAAAQRAIEALQKGGREMGQQLARQFGSGEQSGEGDDGQDGQDEAGNEPGNGGQGNNALGNRDGQTTGPQPGEQQGANRRRTTRRDPLGRPIQNGVSGNEESGDVRVPDTMEEARTRALQEELRRRGAERTRPPQELDYIDRLLKPF